MRELKIYTAGAMKGFDFCEQMHWRSELEQLIYEKCYYNYKISWIHPPMFFQYDEGADEAEIKQWELSQLSDADIVVVNFENIKNSIGTHMELGFIEGIKMLRQRPLYVVGIGEGDTDHPWIESCPLKRVADVKEAAQYIVDYLLR